MQSFDVMRHIETMGSNRPNAGAEILKSAVAATLMQNFWAICWAKAHGAAAFSSLARAEEYKMSYLRGTCDMYFDVAIY